MEVNIALGCLSRNRSHLEAKDCLPPVHNAHPLQAIPFCKAELVAGMKNNVAFVCAVVERTSLSSQA